MTELNFTKENVVQPLDQKRKMFEQFFSKSNLFVYTNFTGIGMCAQFS